MVVHWTSSRDDPSLKWQIIVGVIHLIYFMQIFVERLVQEPLGVRIIFY
jgi:hypothetical protein